MDATSDASGHTHAASALTELMLEVFRLNGRLLAAGDRLVADLGLTSARWQVLGAIALAGTQLPVAHIARNMGLTRQAVQRVVNELAVAGLVEFAPNPYHRRAHLVVLTTEGNNAYRGATHRQAPWANRLAAELVVQDIAHATRVLRALVRRLDASSEPVPDATAPPIRRGETHRGATDGNGSQSDVAPATGGGQRAGVAGEQVRRRR